MVRVLDEKDRGMRMMLALVPPFTIVIIGALLLSLTWFGALVMIFGALDCRGRYRDYKYLQSFNYLTERLALFYGRSFCGRWLVLCIDPFWRYLYRRKGYRIWHLLPDNFLDSIINPRFWRAVFGGHRAI